MELRVKTKYGYFLKSLDKERESYLLVLKQKWMN